MIRLAELEDDRGCPFMRAGRWCGLWASRARGQARTHLSGSVNGGGALDIWNRRIYESISYYEAYFEEKEMSGRSPDEIFPVEEAIRAQKALRELAGLRVC